REGPVQRRLGLRVDRFCQVEPADLRAGIMLGQGRYRVRHLGASVGEKAPSLWALPSSVKPHWRLPRRGCGIAIDIENSSRPGLTPAVHFFESHNGLTTRRRWPVKPGHGYREGPGPTRG